MFYHWAFGLMSAMLFSTAAVVYCETHSWDSVHTELALCFVRCYCTLFHILIEGFICVLVTEIFGNFDFSVIVLFVYWKIIIIRISQLFGIIIGHKDGAS